MKIIKFDNSTEGPFDTVERRELIYVVTVNGITTELPVSVMGQGVVSDWDGNDVQPPPAPIPTVGAFHNWLYQHFNEAAHAVGWDDRNTLYARLANPDGKWWPEAKSFADWIDTCERQALDYLASGQPLPPTREAFIAMLPTWERSQ